MPAATDRLDRTVCLVVFLVGLAFAVHTQHVWEDYWITFRVSRNLATGHGLVFTPGERVHAFTSPLGTLLPAALSWLSGNNSEDLVIWLFRLLSIAALAAGAVFLLHVALTLHKHRISTLFTLGLVALDAKTVDFSINGMETGLVIFFLALTLHGLLVAGPRWMSRIGVGWAGLMWTRPDSFVYIGSLGLAALIFLRDTTTGQTRKEWCKRLFQAGMVCTVLYLPWFLWAWSYYGSPVPHTIVAKATNMPILSAMDLLRGLLLFPFELVAGSSASYVFMPAYAEFGGWHYTLWAAARALRMIASLAWLFPPLRPQTRMLSLAFYLNLFFLDDVVRRVAPWYLPPASVLGYLTIGLVFDQLLSLPQRLRQRGWDRVGFRQFAPVLRAAAIALVASQAVVTICVARQMAVQQELIEDGIRRQIGLWLRNNAESPKDTVFLEPLGYIGYFSQLKMLDWPGLSSKEVIGVRRRLGPDKESQVFLELKPDWLVLRPLEIRQAHYIDPRRLEEFYKPVRMFDARDKVRALRWIPGRHYLLGDQTFLIYRRKAN